MKNTLCLVVMIGAAISAYAWADDFSMKIKENIFRIQVGSHGMSASSTRELQERVWQLERAVYQLQEQVFQLRADDRPRIEEKSYSCYVKTPFDGTFTGKGKTKTEAQGKAFKACGEKAMGVHCNERNLKCDD